MGNWELGIGKWEMGIRPRGRACRRAGSVMLAGLFLGSAPVGAQSSVGKRYDAERVTHDAEHYDIWIRLADSGSRFEAKVATRWKLTGPTPIRINLDSSYRI